jgi:predicted PurR-regulated permease PerM
MAGLAVWLMSTTLIDQFSQLAQQIPESIEQIREALDETEIGRVFLRALPEPEALVQSATNVATRTAGIFSTIIGAVSAALIILFIGVYCSLDPSLYVNGMLRLIPIDKRERAHQILRALTHVLRWWLVGRIFSMLVLGILTGVGLWLLGVPLALALGVLTGLLTFIPYLGSILSFIPIIVLALSKGFTLGLYALFLYLGVQTIESYFLTPYVEKKAVALPPSLTLIVQVISGILFGILGIIVASPLTAAVMVLVRTLYVRDFLGDDISITKSKETDAQIE